MTNTRTQIRNRRVGRCFISRARQISSWYLSRTLNKNLEGVKLWSKLEVLVCAEWFTLGYSHHKMCSWWQTGDKELRTDLTLISNCCQHTCTLKDFNFYCFFINHVFITVKYMTVLYQLFINYQTSHLKKIILICKISYFLICLSIFHQANAFKNYKKNYIIKTILWTTTTIIY